MIDLGNARIGTLKTDTKLKINHDTKTEYTGKQGITVESDGLLKINGKLMEAGTHELKQGDNLEFFGGYTTTEEDNRAS